MHVPAESESLQAAFRHECARGDYSSATRDNFVIERTRAYFRPAFWCNQSRNRYALARGIGLDAGVDIDPHDVHAAPPFAAGHFGRPRRSGCRSSRSSRSSPASSRETL